MEGLGAAASALAVIEIAAKVGDLCLQYVRKVKNAKHDIERFRQHIEDLKAIVEGAQRLLQGPDGSRFETAQNLRSALANARSQLDPIHARLDGKLNNGLKHRAMRRMGLRALVWPFESNEVEEIISDLRQERDAISAALQIDQITLALDINRKIVLSKLPIAKSAAFDAQANEHDPSCHPDTRVDLLADIHKWIEDPNGKCIFWLRGMAGTGKSTISRTVAKKLSAEKVPSASFFFKKGEGDRGSAAMFFTTILRQLVYPHGTHPLPLIWLGRRRDADGAKAGYITWSCNKSYKDFQGLTASLTLGLVTLNSGLLCRTVRSPFPWHESHSRWPFISQMWQTTASIKVSDPVPPHRGQMVLPLPPVGVLLFVAVLVGWHLVRFVVLPLCNALVELITPSAWADTLSA
ncbi:hypothetical protein GGTG_12137 [Gaeumannomyces tritici R3-111a-1]|uniref:Nephrocystin 3-like N-terminal domain-containing protein n=1 Tax=Gaeumannomyces tritici (strain R3-111a-1) TaxID=644352 RepID=J3PF58_GAET3|nr:hypothetical protein GGTG_12137 [Gaeumannomyces tritici R3-111a-1]EJT69960.1 hypothetical protein GGTG_12137 [Gaeumannomyces tritici R3-111a-1]